MIWGVYSSPEKAVELIKADYGPPYVVEWEPLRTDQFGDMSLVGHFQAVTDKSAHGSITFDIRPFTLDGTRS